MRAPLLGRRILLTIPLCAVLAASSGCRKDFTTEADMLREQVMELEQRVESLEREKAELQAQFRQRARPREDVPEDVLAATPRVADISIGRLSHGRLARDYFEPDVLRLYINPVDGRGRFVPLVGTLSIHAAVLTNGDAVTIARQEMTPEQVRDAYRSGFTGTHYTIHLPIDWPDEIDPEAARAQPVVVRVTYDDGHTGERFIAERSLSWRVGR
jgi:hypothetical protein